MLWGLENLIWPLESTICRMPWPPSQRQMYKQASISGSISSVWMLPKIIRMSNWSFSEASSCARKLTTLGHRVPQLLDDVLIPRGRMTEMGNTVDCVVVYGKHFRPVQAFITWIAEVVLEPTFSHHSLTLTHCNISFHACTTNACTCSNPASNHAAIPSLRANMETKAATTAKAMTT